MALVYKENNKDGVLIGIWEIIEQEDYFLDNLILSKNDQSLLNNAKSKRRRIEILSIRLLMKNLGLNFDISYTHTGKPTIQNGNISISHSKQYAAVIYHHYKTVSIDIEKPTEILFKAKHLVFNKNELSFADNNRTLFTILWCCKECVVKMTDNLSVNFLSQINIQPFYYGDIIKCDYVCSDEIKQYKFHYFSLNDHIVVWGNENKR